MIATGVKAWSIGFLLSIVLFGFGEFGTHTPMQLAFLFVLPFFGIAVEIARVMGARPPAEVLTNSLTLAFSTGFYGAVVFHSST